MSHDQRYTFKLILEPFAPSYSYELEQDLIDLQESYRSGQDCTEEMRDLLQGIIRDHLESQFMLSPLDRDTKGRLHTETSLIVNWFRNLEPWKSDQHQLLPPVYVAKLVGDELEMSVFPCECSKCSATK